MTFTVDTVVYEELPLRPKDAFRFAVISDVHLGHRRTATRYIIDNLNRYVTRASFMAQLDCLFISGDLFDDIVTLASRDSELIFDWMDRLLKLAVSTKTAIRVLEGTPSHDWEQPRHLHEKNQQREIKADLQYIDDLSIVDDKSLGMVIGYVPDECREHCDQITHEWRELMATHGYDQVDLLIMHGMFGFQIPKAAAKSVSTFNEDEWSQWSRYGIYIGHDHRFKHHYNIVVPSSFERLAHGEEERKGFLVVDIVANHVHNYHVENIHAMKYITVNGEGLDDVTLINNVEAQLARFGELGDEFTVGRLRVQYSAEYDIGAVLKEWRAQYPTIVIESERISDGKHLTMGADESFHLKGETINITAENIEGIILRELGDEVPSDMSALLNEIQYIQDMVA
jgi:hypothetical protein